MKIETQREFFRAAGMWLESRLNIEQEIGDPFQRTLGEIDRRAEMFLILHESRITSHKSLH